MSPLAADLTQFLQFQWAAGYRYREEAGALGQLDRFLAVHLPAEDPVITPDLIRAYLARRGAESETTREHRLSLLRQVCRFLALREPRTALPPPRCLGIHRRPFVARVLTREEGRRVVAACAAYPGRPGYPLRGVVHGTALILLYLTGLRAGEVVRLTVADVDLQAAVLRVRNTKFGKNRLVPLAADLAARLGRCHAAVGEGLGPRKPDAPFFPGPAGQPCTIYGLRYTFRRVLAAAGLPRQCGDRGPRLHDLRHSFATLRLLLWAEQGADLGTQLPRLATYLGHVGVVSSQRYLQLTPELHAEVTRRHEARFGHLIPEGRTP
jgi:integrase